MMNIVIRLVPLVGQDVIPICSSDQKTERGIFLAN